MFDYRAKLAKLLRAGAEALDLPATTEGGNSRFVDLAPTDAADENGVYTAALSSATSNDRVFNIALTGPYGSGKSSVIKSFLKNYGGKPLHISLAAFLPEAVSPGGVVSKQEIERSILQQMLYGADANRLPLSRFKRIQSPGRWSIPVSLFVVFGVVALWRLIQKRDDVMTGEFFRPFDFTNWFNLVTFGVGSLFVWLLFYRLYVASFGISLKSVSLKDIEITPEAVTSESILNRHLDEIIYFFQSTTYDLVVIEDLDRFEDTEIFVTLREINALVNGNFGVKRRVRFLYALRDDMFKNTDRTKFFEFIVPVIPIISSTNSIDKVLDQGRRLSLEDRLNGRFLREVSIYLTDLRLIQNIFNEYAIYIANLDPKNENGLDADKLLAILIYKNMYPSDFEKLHRGKGHLAGILHGHGRYVAAREASYTAEIARLEGLLEIGDRQLADDLTDLRRIYAMAIVELIPDATPRISINQSVTILARNLTDDGQLEMILSASKLYFINEQGYWQPFPKDELEAKVGNYDKFEQRKSDLEKKSASFRDQTSKQLNDLREKLNNIRLTKFSSILREYSDENGSLFDGFGDNADLARYLVLEGYLDDTYYQYTSLFHAGRLSPNDHRFLLSIRSYRNPTPDFQVDNPKEVIDAMRDEDFDREFALNVKIADCLLAGGATFSSKKQRMLQFIASDFDRCEAFLASYYERGVAVEELVAGLVKTWPEFPAAVMASPSKHVHAARIIRHLPDRMLSELAKNPDLSEFVSNNLAEVLAQGIDFPPERLTLLRLETRDLSSIESHPLTVKTLFEHGQYALSIENLEFIYRNQLRLSQSGRLREQNYTALLETGNGPLLEKVDRRFADYLRNVLFALPGNSHETVPTILRVINRKEVDFDDATKLLAKQTALLPSLEGVPVDLHAELFRLQRIEPTWENCLAFQRNENFDEDVLTEFLNRGDTVAALRKSVMPDVPEGRTLHEFLFENDALSDEAYAVYIQCLPHQADAFPESVSVIKTTTLVDRNLVVFSPENLTHLSTNTELGVEFVRKNIAAFFDAQDDCDVDDDFRQKLLERDIGDEARLRILSSMDFDALEDIPARAALVGDIVARTKAQVAYLGVDAARAVVLASRPLETQITLLNLFHDKFDDEQVKDLLHSMPSPLPDIRPGFDKPRLPDTPINVEFVTWLETRKIISSWSKVSSFFDQGLRINNFRK